MLSGKYFFITIISTQTKGTNCTVSFSRSIY